MERPRPNVSTFVIRLELERHEALRLAILCATCPFDGARIEQRRRERAAGQIRGQNLMAVDVSRQNRRVDARMRGEKRTGNLRPLVVSGNDHDRDSQVGDALERLEGAHDHSRLHPTPEKNVTAMNDEIDLASQCAGAASRLLRFPGSTFPVCKPCEFGFSGPYCLPS